MNLEKIGKDSVFRETSILRHNLSKCTLFQLFLRSVVYMYQYPKMFIYSNNMILEMYLEDTCMHKDLLLNIIITEIS